MNLRWTRAQSFCGYFAVALAQVADFLFLHGEAKLKERLELLGAGFEQDRFRPAAGDLAVVDVLFHRLLQGAFDQGEPGPDLFDRGALAQFADGYNMTISLRTLDGR